jgi:uncharacterized membrane protein
MFDADSCAAMNRQEAERWRTFIAFWLVGGLALLAIGIAVFAGVHHGRRLGGVLALLGVGCLAIGVTVWRIQRADG